MYCRCSFFPSFLSSVRPSASVTRSAVPARSVECHRFVLGLQTITRDGWRATSSAVAVGRRCRCCWREGGREGGGGASRVVLSNQLADNGKNNAHPAQAERGRAKRMDNHSRLRFYLVYHIHKSFYQNALLFTHLGWGRNSQQVSSTYIGMVRKFSSSLMSLLL